MIVHNECIINYGAYANDLRTKLMNNFLPSISLIPTNINEYFNFNTLDIIIKFEQPIEKLKRNCVNDNNSDATSSNNESKYMNEQPSSLWNLLMRLPFNLQILGNQTQLQQQQNDNNNDNNVIGNVNWNLFIDSSSWLDSFMTLNGLQHLYYTLINFSYASYRVLYMLFKIFLRLTSHELIGSDPLYTRCKPRHNTPKILKIRTVNGTLSKCNPNELDVLKLGTKIFELIFEILQNS